MKKFKFDAERGWGHCKGTIEKICKEGFGYRITANTQIGYVSFMVGEKLEVGSEHIFAYAIDCNWVDIDDELEFIMEGEEYLLEGGEII